MESKKDIKLFLSLILWMLIPSIYMCIRMNIVTVNDVNIDILGQMEWFDLIDEIIITMFTIPLYSLLKDKDAKRNGFALLTSFGIYAVFTVVLSLCIANIAEFMQAEYAVKYLRLQSISMLIGFISTFCIILFVIDDNYKLMATLTIGKLLLLAVCDYIFIGKYSDLGASYSEILTNIIIATVAVICTIKLKYIAIGMVDKEFIISWIKLGAFCGLQIFLDNFIYMMMVCRMVNAVAESGSYWIANNFIWGWLLVPITCLAQIIQKNKLTRLTFRNAGIYICVFTGIWICTKPFWGWFMSNAMGIENPNTIINIVNHLIVYYLCYMAAACLDAWFVSLGKTSYLLIISMIVNIGYYGLMYIGFQNNLFDLNMSFVETLFGVGMVVHLVVGVILYLLEYFCFHKSTKKQYQL